MMRSLVHSSFSDHDKIFLPFVVLRAGSFVVAEYFFAFVVFRLPTGLFRDVSPGKVPGLS
jgi:hypothetical protein